MRVLRRCFDDYWALWRILVPLLVVLILATPLSLFLPLVEKKLVDKVLLARQIDLLLPTLALYAVLWLGSTVMNRIVVVGIRAYLDQRFMNRMRERVFDHCEKLSFSFLQERHSSQIVSLFFNDIPSLTSLFSTTFITGFASLITLVVGITIMVSLNWQLALAIGILPPIVTFAGAFLTRRLRPISRQLQETAAELVQRIQENLSGVREVVAFGQEKQQRAGFTNALDELLRLRMRIAAVDISIGTGTSVFSLVVMGVIFGFGGYLVIQQSITLGTLLAMQLLYEQITQPVNQLFGLGGSIQKALGAADRIYGLLDEIPLVQERPQAIPPQNIKGLVTFDRVNFSYGGGKHALDDVSFVVQPGEMVALVGPSGAGKTTLVSLILRLYDPATGSVRLDEHDIRDFTLAGLRSQIGIVFQDTYLFATTIRENIAISRPTSTTTEIERAARAANAWEFIESLPAGLETYVGERGVQLSQGQRQRLAIARAFLRDPRILILDEPTSALDGRSEHLIQLAVADLMRERTTFVIAHRLATVRQADQIIVLDQGRVVEQGTHEALLQRQGLYHELFEFQFGDSEAAEGARAPKPEVLVAS